jgi:hypothetical protein
MQRAGEGVVLSHASHLLCVVVGLVGACWRRRAHVAVSVRPPAVTRSIPRCSSGPGDRRLASVGGAPCREYRPVLISNDNPRICDGDGFSRTARRDQPKAGVDAVERSSPGHLQPAINAQFTAGGAGQCEPAAMSSTCRPRRCVQCRAALAGRHGRAGEPRFRRSDRVSLVECAA